MRAAILLALASCISKPDRPPEGDAGGSGSGSDTWAWVERENAGQPGTLESPRLAFDPTLKTVVLWSGSDADNHTVSTMWAYDASATKWIVVCATTGSVPCAIPERWRGGFASNDTAVFNFGGSSYTGSYKKHDDVWSFTSGVAWMALTADGASGSPLIRDNAQMVWDPDHSWFYIYGGYTSIGVDDLWTYTPTTAVFTQLNGTTSGGQQTGSGPVLAGQGQEITYDTKRKRLLTLIDNDGAGEFDEIWAYSRDSGAWSPACSGCTGIKREFAALLYVPTLDATLIISGQPHDPAAANLLNTTPKIGASWMLQGDATKASQLDTSPAVSSAGIAYDPVRDAVVLYGGDGCGSSGADRCSNTWEFVKQ